MADTIHDQSLSQSILKTLLYYDLFLYPLTSTEVFQFLSTNHVTEKEVDKRLCEMADESIIYRLGTFFSIQNNSDLESRRATGNRFALKSMELARRQARRIARFPFVRGVLISGSLAKGYMDENSDLDFFIITAPRRLWIARTLLVLYKRVFLFNSHKYFCVNYFIDSEHLEIEEKNLFTATELATLLPVCNPELYVEFLQKNVWVESFFPNYLRRPLADIFPLQDSIIRWLGEKIINFGFGAQFEKYFREMTLKRWNKHYRHQYTPGDFQVAFKSRAYVSKNHPNNYQRKVMELYEQRLRDFASCNKLTWQT